MSYTPRSKYELPPTAMAEAEVATKLAYHITNPCSCEAGDLRGFYLAEARNVLPTLSHPGAKFILENVLSQYE